MFPAMRLAGLIFFISTFGLILLTGQQPKDEQLAPYYPTPQIVVDKMLQLGGLKAGEKMFDLGSGDGRIVIRAAKNFGARGVGVEIDPALIKSAAKNAAKAGVSDRVTFRQEDLFKTDLSGATVVTLYLSNSINMRLRGILERLKPGTRIVSHRFTMGDWKPDAERRLEGTSIYLWTIPGRP